MIRLLPALLLLGCRVGSPAGVPQERAAERHGKQLYAAICAPCHGDDGRGKTAIAAQLHPPPGDLASCNFKYRSTPSGELPTDTDLLRTLVVGIPGTRMASLAGVVREGSLEALVREVKRRCRSFSDEGASEPIPWPGSRGATAEDETARGRVVFEREQCRACHGDSGHGDGPAARSLKDVSGRPIRPRDFTQGVFRGGVALVDIYRAFSTGLNGTPMPALRAAVPTAERWALAGYVASLGHERDGRPRRPAERTLFWYRRLAVWGAEAPPEAR